MSERRMLWKVNTPALLKEIADNSGAPVLRMPLAIFGRLLALVADRASQLNDFELNKLMLRLALYEQGDQNSKKYSRKAMRAHGL